MTKNTEWSEDLMGQWVTVTKRLDRYRTRMGNGRCRAEWKPKDITPNKGMITGRRWLKNGIVVLGGGAYDDYEPGYLIDIDIVPCIRVVFDSRHNPVYVPMDGFEVI